MATLFTPLLFLSLFFSLVFSCCAQTCSNYAFTSNKIFNSCNDLPVLNSFLHWNYNSSSRTVDIAFRHTNVSSSRWVSWAINPTSKGMIGSQALIAFQDSNGTMRAYTSSITNYTTQLQQGNLSFLVPTISAEFVNNEITIFASLELPNNSSIVTHLWQEGPVNGDFPNGHLTSGDNVMSIGTLDFLSTGGVTGQTAVSNVGNSRLRRRNVHGVLNALSWGTLIPLGAIIARYLKLVNSAGSAWFYLHMGIQHSAYIVGVVGWATGLKLGSESVGIQYTAHRYIGIVLFCLGTLQVFALLLRPSPDHKYRFYWKLYHQLTGYTVIILSVINVFKGLEILDPEKKWKQIYILIISTIGIVAILLELLTWIRILKTKKNKKDERKLNQTDGANDEYGFKPQLV